METFSALAQGIVLVILIGWLGLFLFRKTPTRSTEQRP
jgi:hypothetical protein